MDTLEQQIVLYVDDKGTKRIYDSAYTPEQIRFAIAGCKMEHRGSVPTTILASKFGGRLKA